MDLRIVCISDLHGHLPRNVPDCDLLLLGGDYCPMKNIMQQRQWLATKFSKWLDRLRSRGVKVVGVAGNHDFLFEPTTAHLVPDMDWVYLQDSGIEAFGLKIWGSPWQPRYRNWAFNLDEPELAHKWSLIPDDIDVLLLHGPPHLHGDYTPWGEVHTGSPSLLARIKEISPKLVAYGHIHSGYGRYTVGDSLLVNAAYVDEEYRPANDFQVVQL